MLPSISDDYGEVVDVTGLLQVVEGTFLDRIHCRRHRATAGEDDHLHQGAQGLDGGQGCQTVHARHGQIKHHNGNLFVITERV
jgi:hypothetical protein